MNIVIYRRGSVQTFKATILSIADGYLIENDYLQYDDIEKLGLRYDRGAFSTDPDEKDARFFRKSPMVLVKPEELESVLLIKVDGTDLFIRNTETGNLDCRMDAILDETLLRYQESLILEEGETFEENSISQIADEAIGSDEMEDNFAIEDAGIDFDDEEFLG